VRRAISIMLAVACLGTLAAAIVAEALKCLTFAHRSYTFYAWTRPRNEPWRVNPIDATASIATARQVRANGAQAVVVSLEWGVDGKSVVTSAQRALAQTLTASGQIDLIGDLDRQAERHGCAAHD